MHPHTALRRLTHPAVAANERNSGGVQPVPLLEQQHPCFIGEIPRELRSGNQLTGWNLNLSIRIGLSSVEIQDTGNRSKIRNQLGIKQCTGMQARLHEG